MNIRFVLLVAACACMATSAFGQNPFGYPSCSPGGCCGRPQVNCPACPVGTSISAEADSTAVTPPTPAPPTPAPPATPSAVQESPNDTPVQSIVDAEVLKRDVERLKNDLRGVQRKLDSELANESPKSNSDERFQELERSLKSLAAQQAVLENSLDAINGRLKSHESELDQKMKSIDAALTKLAKNADRSDSKQAANELKAIIKSLPEMVQQEIDARLDKALQKQTQKWKTMLDNAIKAQSKQPAAKSEKKKQPGK